mmetsp:Transcript_27375/g.38881  ORF Transcript_27375/g.38881 Transcript_27375/m.38881 type:complete len:185 (-) Transcript_27375:163-717(-)
MTTNAIILYLMNYAHFIVKAKANIEIATTLYQKALQLGSDHPSLLANYAHFLMTYHEETGSKKGHALHEAQNYFERALKAVPNNIQWILWYAKCLKRSHKVAQAELMYRVAVDKSSGQSRMEPIAICNYGTFIFNHRKDTTKAMALLQNGLTTYPAHRGLLKNYGHMVKQLNKASSKTSQESKL